MSSIQHIDPHSGKKLYQENGHLTDGNEVKFDLLNGAYRFVKGETYADSFGFQWNKFVQTQLDRYNRSSTQSRERFFAVTNWDKEDLQGQYVLEVGSGAGRFSQIVLDHTHAFLYSVDYSNAIEANYQNNGPHERLQLYQASVYELPFSPGQFDKVFCFGVLQHTPDFRKSVEKLVEMVKPGGELVIDFYPIKGWYSKIHAKYLLRPFTRNMEEKKLLNLLENNIDGLMGWYNFFDRIWLGKLLNRFLPIVDMKKTFPRDLTKEQKREWAILDTFDMFSPTHDHPQKIQTVKKWFEEFGMKEIWGGMIKYHQSNEVAVVKGRK